jgi:hypothetical protein
MSQNISFDHIFLVVALIISVVALVYAIKNKQDLDDLESHQGVKSNFSSMAPHTGLQPTPNNLYQPDPSRMHDDYSNYEGNSNNHTAYDRTSDVTGDWWNTSGNNTTSMNGPMDGNDVANSYTGGAAQSQCAPAAQAEAYHPSASTAINGPRMVPSAASYSSPYPDETAAASLAGKTTYSCAPDVTATGGCDYAINPQSLMPGSWREGVSCSAGVDPNSQWAKYSPTREKYYRYVTAQGSARLGVNTRSPMRKILGIQNYLRSATSTPLTAASVTPFNESSQRAQAIFDATGTYPGGPQQSLGC